jgi:hypothetical protein
MKIVKASVTFKTDVEILCADVEEGQEPRSEQWYQAALLKQAIQNVNRGDTDATLKIAEEKPNLVKRLVRETA